MSNLDWKSNNLKLYSIFLSSELKYVRICWKIKIMFMFGSMLINRFNWIQNSRENLQKAEKLIQEISLKNYRILI